MAPDVSILPPVAEARAALARRLAFLRQAAGFTQAQAAYRLSYSRSAVARAEVTGVCSRDFCRLAGQLYGGRRARRRTRPHRALAITAPSQAARQARRARHGDRLPPGGAASAEETGAAFTAVEAACPHCRKPVAVLIRHSTALLPVESTRTLP
jgi:hypothetical protein